MASLMVVHLSGEERGKTLIFDQEAITLGPDEGCDLPLNIPAVHNGDIPRRLIVAEIYRQKHNFDLFFRDPEHYSLLVNRKPTITNDGPIPLSDGDLLSLQAVKTSELHLPTELLVHVVQEIEETKTGVRNAHLQFPEVDMGGRIHPRTASRFAKELIIALYAEIPPWARVFAIILSLVIPLCILVSTGIVFVGVMRYYEILDRFSNLSRAAESQLEDLLTKNEALRQEVDSLKNVLNSGQNIAQAYGPGVCLIEGTYSFTNRQTNKPLRFIDNSFNQSTPLAADGSLQVSFDGTGDIYYEQFTGTGFVVAEGKLVTNRHIAQPWFNDPTDSILINSLGGKPEIKGLNAYFPGIKSPFALKVLQISSENDVALCSFIQGDAAIPQLPLETSEETKNMTGQGIVLLGYPTGVEGIREALPDERLKDELRKRMTFSDLAAELSNRGYIYPKVSQGHITQFITGRIVHDAQTTEGGSGSPIFNSFGKVVGINAQVMLDEQERIQASLGVPISAAVELLKDSEK
ncbi:MAG TPA: trypsin-like peptidase domain-containing protein [Acidobacteriota bacterium]|nr:trypsin-like peptidase domain-containing protein [Acidobacteriota bacterium]HNG93553.1 trypsin-like peptidase domain-containing protein [Acidobacteriota bacterium]HNH81744.1 trypsin-like peptidase domain-containing protein [Acidobacteriota bacterium]